jgi:hypothetical protein
MADIIGGFTFTVNNATNTITVGDNNPYVANGVVSGSTINIYLKKLTSPNGTVIHVNPVSSGVPDVTYTFAGIPNGSISVAIPTYDDNTCQFGNYIVEFEAVVGSDNYKKDKTFTYLEYATPTAQLTITADTVTPLFTVEDSTNYVLTLYGDLEPSVTQSTRLITIEFPNDIATDLTGSAITLSTGTFYSKTQTVTIIRDITYFVGDDLDFFIVDQVNLTVTEEVVLPYDLCTISALVDNLYAQLTNAENFSNDQTNIRAKWLRAVGLLVMIREALSCGFKEGLDAYAEEVKSLASYCDDVPDTDDPILISGLSAFDNNTLTVGYATDTSGTNLALAPFSGYSHYAFFAHNKKYTPIASDFSGLWQVKPSGGLDVSLTPNFFAKADALGTGLEESIMSQPSGNRFKVGNMQFFVGNVTGTKGVILQDKSGTLALLSDIQNSVTIDGLSEFLADGIYTEGETIYAIDEENILFYLVETGFTAANPLVIANEITASNVIEIQTTDVFAKIEDYNPFATAGVVISYPAKSVIKDNTAKRLYRAKINSLNTIALTNTTYWEIILDDYSSVPGTSVTLAVNGRIVAPETDNQAFAEGVDAALLKARGTGVTTSYTSSVAVGGTTFAQPNINGEINSDEGYFSITHIGSLGISVNDLTSASTYVYIDKAGNRQQQTSIPTRQDWTRKIFTMRIAVDTSSNLILGFEYLNNPIGHYANSVRDLYSYLLAQGVPFKKDQVITGRAADLGFDVSAGSFFEFGGTGDIHEPNTPQLDAVANASYTLLSRTAIISTETNLVKSWDNNTVITALGSTTFVGHRLYRFANGNFAIQYGQANYANILLAKAGIGSEDYVLNPLLKNATFFGWWLIEDTATNTSGTTLTAFIEYTLGIQGGVSNGLSGALLKGNDLNDLLNNTAARINFLGSLLDAAAENMLEQKVVSALIEVTIADGLYTFPTTTGRDFVFEITEDTTLTMPTLAVSTSIAFSADIIGDFAITLTGFAASSIQGNYDGTVVNVFTFRCYKKANGTQVNTVYITNLI